MQLSGLASGFDWQSLVTQMIRAESIPRNRMYNEQSSLRSEKTAWSDLDSKLESLKDSIQDLNTSSVFYGRQAVSNVSEDPTMTAEANESTLTGKYTFNVTAIATSTDIAGASNVGSTLAPTADVSGATLSTLNLSTKITEGSFTVNGEKVSVSTSDSLQDVFDAISTATGGAVTGSYDAGTDKVTLSGASVVLGSASDDSNFLSAMKLNSNESGNAVSSASLGVVNLSAGLNTGFSGLSTEPTVADSFKINGVDIAYDPSQDTMREVMERINNSEADVRITYDSTNDQFNLESQATGSLDITLEDSAEGFLAQMGLITGATRTLGNNAQYSVNGGATLTSTSNELTGDSHGIEGLSVTATAIAEETITVSPENTGAKDKIKDFIEEYNSVIEFIEQKSKTTTDGDEVKTSVFSGNRDITDIGRNLRRYVFEATDGLAGDVKRLADMGIDFTVNGQLEIDDEDALDDALLNNADAVATIFTNSSDGLYARTKDYLENLTTINGTIDSMSDSIDNKISRLDDQIDRQTRYLESKEELLTQQFLRMEEAQSNMQQQLAQLTQSL